MFKRFEVFRLPGIEAYVVVCAVPEDPQVHVISDGATVFYPSHWEAERRAVSYRFEEPSNSYRHPLLSRPLGTPQVVNISVDDMGVRVQVIAGKTTAARYRGGHFYEVINLGENPAGDLNLAFRQVSRLQAH